MNISRIKIDRESIPLMLFSLLFGIWIFVSILTTSMFSIYLWRPTVFRVGIIALMGLLDVSLYWDWYKICFFKKPHIVYYFLAIIVVAISAYNHDYLLPQVIALAYLARHYSLEQLFRLWFFSCFVSVGFVVAGCVAGIIPDFILSSEALLGPKHSLGFRWSTFLSHFYLSMVIALTAYKRRNLSIRAIIALLLLGIAIFALTGARNSFLLVVLLLISIMIIKLADINLGRMPKILKWICCGSFVFFAVFSASFLLGIDASSPVGQAADSVLSGRLKYTQQAFQEYPVLVAGNKDLHYSTRQYFEDGTIATGYYTNDKTFVPAPYLYVDCSYLSILLRSGPVVLVIVLTLFTVLNFYLGKRNNWTIVLLLVVWAVHSIVDPQLIYLHYSPLPLLLAKPWFDATGLGKHVRIGNKASVPMRECC